MSDLPEINFKEKKEDKKGFLPWLRSRFGVGGRGAMGGEAPGAANFGRALGAGRFGASSGIGGLLAGKAGLVLTAAVVAAALGTGIYMNNQPSPGISAGSFSTNQAPDNYVPAILRGNKTQGSSLDMFKETNKGAAGMDEVIDQGETKDASNEQPAAEQPAEAAPPAPVAAGEQLKLKLSGGGFGGGLSNTSAGGGSQFGKLSGLGTRSNPGSVGANSGIPGFGSGFANAPKFDQRKKVLAMAGSKRPVFSRGQGVGRQPITRSSFGQARGVRAQQRSFRGTDADSTRSTQDRAWEGNTDGGAVSGAGAGVTDGQGGAGIMTSPSLDNASAGGGNADADDPGIAEVTAPTDVSPWQGLPQRAMMYVMLSAMLTVIGAMVIRISSSCGTFAPLVRGIGMAICAVALGLGLMAVMIGIKLMSSFGQGMLGTVYTIGGGIAMGAAGVAMATGSPGAAVSPMVFWLAGAAGVLGMLGSMAGGKAV